MPSKETRYFTHTCDGCKRELTTNGKQKPSTMSDPWATIKLDQDAGWDLHGYPWAPRMRDPILLCGSCTERVVQVVNTLGSLAPMMDVVFDGPPEHVAGRFVEVEDADGKSINVGKWLERNDGYWVLRMPRPVEQPDAE